MSIFPDFNYETINTQPTTEIPELGSVFLFDFNTGNFIMKDGKFIEATYEQKIRMWIDQLIRTEKYKYTIFSDSDYGLELDKFVGLRNIPIGVISSEIKRQIEEQIVLHPHIEGIQNFTFERKSNKAIINFDVILITGDTMQQEVTINV